MGRDPRDKLLRKIDEAMSLLEVAEESLGRLAGDARRAGIAGSLYWAYTSLMRLRDKLVELREEAYNLQCCGCRGEGRGAGQTSE